MGFAEVVFVEVIVIARFLARSGKRDHLWAGRANTPVAQAP